MKNYIKPTFTLAGLAPVALATNNCSVDIDDRLTIIQGIYGDNIPSNVFAMGEECESPVPVDDVCKFSFVEQGAAVITGS